MYPFSSFPKGICGRRYRCGLLLPHNRGALLDQLPRLTSDIPSTLWSFPLVSCPALFAVLPSRSSRALLGVLRVPFVARSCSRCCATILGNPGTRALATPSAPQTCQAQETSKSTISTGYSRRGFFVIPQGNCFCTSVPVAPALRTCLSEGLTRSIPSIPFGG